MNIDNPSNYVIKMSPDEPETPSPYTPSKVPTDYGGLTIAVFIAFFVIVVILSALYGSGTPGSDDYNPHPEYYFFIR